MEFIKESKGDSHVYYLPTYEECVEMCSVNEEGVFYEVKTEVYGYPVSMFNYRFAQYSNFVNPIPNKPNVKAFEMRGLTFVFNKDGSLFKRYLLLDKFFNLNQTPDSMYSVVKDYKVLNVMNKEDGSLASFIPLPNGKIVGRSKMSFISDQAIEIQRIYSEDKTVQEFIKFCMDRDLVPIFEFVAPNNRIVVPYANTDLILLRIRDNKTGKYLDINQFADKLDSLSVCNFEKEHVLDNLVTAADVVEGKEGFVVMFENGKMIKIKSKWYCSLHGLLTNDIYREHVLIELILSDQIDDVISQIPEDQIDTRERIDKIISIVRTSINEKSNEIKKLYDFYIKSKMTPKEFALSYRSDPNFGFVMSLSKNDIDFDHHFLAKKWLRENTKRLSMAREFLKKKDPSLFLKPIKILDDENN